MYKNVYIFVTLFLALHCLPKVYLCLVLMWLLFQHNLHALRRWNQQKEIYCSLQNTLVSYVL